MEVVIIPSNPGPLVRRRQLGAALRKHRTDAGLSLVEVAKKLLLSPSKISRIESAQRNISARDVRDLMDLYRITDPATRDELMRLVEESRESAWWTQYNLMPTYERLIGLEGAAATICDYQMGTIPGLLQTPAYAAAVAAVWTDDPDSIKNAVDVRLVRQQLLANGTALKVVVDESVLRRTVGSREIMRDQIRKLIEVSGGSQVEFQVIPLSAGAHKGAVSGFIILQFPQSVAAGSAARMTDIVYLESVVGAGAYIEQPEEVNGYLEAFLGLQEKALDRQATISFMEALLRDV
jgi:transcriptional regulator with XRE-family HTH domain